MALTINPTPVLKGSEATRFLEEIKSNQSNKIDFKTEIQKAKAILAKAKSAKDGSKES